MLRYFTSILFGLAVMMAGLCNAVPITIYVDDSNSNPNPDGTLGNPFPTINQGLIAATDGDTVQVSPGTYPEEVEIRKNITLAGTDRETCIIQTPAPNYGITINSFPVGGKFASIRSVKILQGNTFLDYDQEDGEDTGAIQIPVPGGTGIIIAGAGAGVTIDNVHVSSFAVGLDSTFGFSGGHITNSTFDQNEVGLMLNSTFTDVSTNLITTNISEGVVCVSCGTNFSNNTITGNGIGVLLLNDEPVVSGEQIGMMFDRPQVITASYSDSPSDTQSTSAIFRVNMITENQQAGVFIQTAEDAVPDFGTTADPGRNTFRGNGNPTFVNHSPRMIHAEGNVWGDYGTLKEIRENAILDHNKDSSAGVVIIDKSQEDIQL